MTSPFPHPGKGTTIDVQIRDRKGKLAQNLALPEQHVLEFFRAVTAASSQPITTIDPYGDTAFSHDMCTRMLGDCQTALRAIIDPSARTCAAAIVDAVARVAGDAALNLFLIGN